MSDQQPEEMKLLQDLISKLSDEVTKRLRAINPRQGMPILSLFGKLIEAITVHYQMEMEHHRHAYKCIPRDVWAAATDKNDAMKEETKSEEPEAP